MTHRWDWDEQYWSEDHNEAFRFGGNSLRHMNWFLCMMNSFKWLSNDRQAVLWRIFYYTRSNNDWR